MNIVVIVLFCIIPMCAWVATLIAMKGYELDGERVKTVQAVNAARSAAIADGMSMEEAMEIAKKLINKEDYKVTVIPDGVSVIVK